MWWGGKVPPLAQVKGTIEYIKGRGYKIRRANRGGARGAPPPSLIKGGAYIRGRGYKMNKKGAGYRGQFVDYIRGQGYKMNK